MRPGQVVKLSRKRKQMLVNLTIDLTEEKIVALKQLEMEFDLALEVMDQVRDALRRKPGGNHADISVLLASLSKEPGVRLEQVETEEGLKSAYPCVSEDGSRAIVIELDPLARSPVATRVDAEVFEELIWLKGENNAE